MAQAFFPTTTTWVCPAFVTRVDAECFGGGGSGASGNGAPSDASGGGGGAYSKKLVIPVTPGNSYTVTVGLGGNSVSVNKVGNDGSDSWFLDATTVLAKGGKGGLIRAGGGTPALAGGAGGLSSAGIGDTKFSGGDGGPVV